MIPGSPEWQRLVTASKVAAILGLSPWESPRTMWHRMRGELPSDDGTNGDAKARGHYLERGIIDWWKDRRKPGTCIEQVHCPLDDWGAATPDAVGIDAHGNRYVLDAKTAATDDDWGEPGTDEAPAYYVAQAMWQLACRPGADIAYIAVLFGRPRLGFAEYIIQRDDDLIADIVARCREFYDSLSDDTAAPMLSDHVAEYDAIRKVHADIDRGESVQVPNALIEEYIDAYWAEKRLPAIKARVLDAMGRAQYATNSLGQKLARRQASGEAVALYCTAPNPDEGIAS